MKKTHWRKQLLFSSLAITLVFIPTIFLPSMVRAASITAILDDNDPCLINNGTGDAVIKTTDGTINTTNAVVSVPTNSVAANLLVSKQNSIACATKKATSALKNKTVGITAWGIPVPFSSWDAIRKAAMKIVVNQLTKSTVEWINGKGKPQYITNTRQYFADIANGFAGDFLSQVAGGNLCAPFKPQIVLSLQQSSRNEYNPQCTLTGIGHNLENFYTNFSEGGWESWFSMTQSDSNNPYGAYLEAKSNLDQGIAEKTGLATLESNWNKGFLSTTKCLGTTVHDNTTGKDSCVGATQTITPGSVIETQLNKILGHGVDDLGLARSFDDIVSALVGSLSKKIFMSAAGLFDSTTKGSDYVDSGNGVYDPGTVDTGQGVDPTSGMTCSPDKNNAVFSDSVTWTTTASDSPGLSYTYEWSGTDVPANSTGSSLVMKYASEGNKMASVKITSSLSVDDSSIPTMKTSTISCSPGVKVSKYAPLVVNSCTSTTGESLANEISPFEIDIKGERRMRMARVTWEANVSGGSGNLAKNNPIVWSGEEVDRIRMIIQTRRYGSPHDKLAVELWNPNQRWGDGSNGDGHWASGSSGAIQTITKLPDGSTKISMSRLYEIDKDNVLTDRNVSAKLTVRDMDPFIANSGVASAACQPEVFIYKPR